MEYKSALSGNTRIYYHERGSGEPLVLIMGFGADGQAWEKHAAVYEKHFRCIIPDNRGAGRSDQPQGPYTTSMMAADTIAVMNDAEVQQARVAGISMGGAIAQELAITYPNRVKALALVSTWSRFNNYAKAVYEHLKHIRTSVNAEYFTELLQLWVYAPHYYEEHWDQLKKGAAEAGRIGKSQTRDGFEGQLDACIHHNTTDRLSRIKVPVLITVGEMDIFTPPVFSQIIHEHIPHSILSSYPNAGHVHHWEELHRFNNETLNFFLNH
jgi:pimeloyl-ACP methyl ester carboxylesterase